MDEQKLDIRSTTVSEQWLPTVEVPDLYQVSDQGQVKALSRARRIRGGIVVMMPERILTPNRSHKKGYLRVSLRLHGGKQAQRYVHRLVLEAFVGPCPEGMQARHYPDPDPTNNRLANLSWDTPSQDNYDRVEHGTHQHAKKTHCKHGHEFTPENTGTQGNGGRFCRTCSREGHNRRKRENNTHCRTCGYMFDAVDSRGHRFCSKCRSEQVSAQQRRRPKSTQCKEGHPLVWRPDDSQRYCPVCAAESKRRWKRRHR
jgi:hypothetical protein